MSEMAFPIGVAVSDPDRTIASPWETYTRKGTDADARYFRQLVSREGIVGFVVGLPVHMSGDESRKSLEARAFGQWLEEISGVPVRFHDERFTTVEASQLLSGSGQSRRRRKDLRDQLAAQIILSSFLESTGRQSPGSLQD
jgi:putative Holliday junction resolvase